MLKLHNYFVHLRINCYYFNNNNMYTFSGKLFGKYIMLRTYIGF